MSNKGEFVRYLCLWEIVQIGKIEKDSHGVLILFILHLITQRLWGILFLITNLIAGICINLDDEYVALYDWKINLEKVILKSFLNVLF